MSSADIDSRVHFARLQRIEDDINTLMNTKQLKEMRVWVRNVSILCGTILLLYFVGRPVAWRVNTLYGSQKYHSSPAAIEPAPDSAPLYEGAEIIEANKQEDSAMEADFGAQGGIAETESSNLQHEAHGNLASEEDQASTEEDAVVHEEEGEVISPVDEVQAVMAEASQETPDDEPQPGDMDKPVEEENSGDEESPVVDVEEPAELNRKLLWRS